MDVNAQINRDNVEAQMSAEALAAKQISKMDAAAQAELAKAMGSGRENELLQKQQAEQAALYQQMLQMQQNILFVRVYNENVLKILGRGKDVMKVIKRDGHMVDWCPAKVEEAIDKANLEVEEEDKASSIQIKNIIKYIFSIFTPLCNLSVETKHWNYYC